MTEQTISENQFADALIRYVQNNPDVDLTDEPNQPLTDYWILRGGLNNQALFNLTRDSEEDISSFWHDFEQQYLSSATKVLDCIDGLCRKLGSQYLPFQPHEELVARLLVARLADRGYEVQMSVARENMFKDIIQMLSEQGMVTEPTKTYKDCPSAIGIALDNQVIDVPGDEYGFSCFIHSMKEGRESLDRFDRPQPPKRYDTATPVAFIVANMSTDSPSETAMCRVRELAPHGKIKFQNIAYVLAEKKDTQITPCMIGHKEALMVGRSTHGIPYGHQTNELKYHVPTNCIDPIERCRQDISHVGWRIHQSAFVERHPELELNR